MADFQSGVNPVQTQSAPLIATPVDDSAANAIKTAGNFTSVVGTTLAQGAAQGKLIEQKTNEANFMSNYSQDLLRVADLEQQGVLKPDQALRQYRLRTARMIANHPLMQEDIFKTYGSIVEKAGLGLNVAKDYQQEQDNANNLRMQALTEAQKVGWGKPTDPPEVQQQLADAHQRFLFNQSQIDASNKLLEHKTKENQLVSSGLQIQNERASIANQSITMQRNRIGLAQDQAKQQFLNGAKNLSDAYFDKWQYDTGNILKQVQGGTLKQEDAVRMVNEQLASIHSQTGALAIAYDSQGSLDALTKPLDMLAQNTIDQITGKIKADSINNNVNNIVGLKNIQLLSNDPAFLTLTSASKLIPAGAGALQQQLGDAAVNLLKRNNAIPGSPQSTKPGDITHNDDPAHNDGVNQYFKVVKGAMSNLNAGINDPDLKSEIDGNITKILAGVGTYSKTMSSPKELNGAVEFFADPQVGKYLTSNPELVSGDAAVQAKVAYDQDYQRAVLPLVQEEFLNANVHVDVGEEFNPFGGESRVIRAGANPENSKPSATLIAPQFNGVGVTFIPIDRSNASAAREAQRLNREVSPIVTNLIKAGAHLEGNTDYKAQYERLMTQIQPPAPPAEAGE